MLDRHPTPRRFGEPALLFLGLRYPPRAWGLRRPSRRGWLALGAAILLNIIAGLVRLWLPSGEQVGPTGVDLAQQVAGGAAVLALFLSILLGAALPQAPGKRAPFVRTFPFG